jgi:heparan-alpha-glucosaminide N-acetyltransferase
MTLTWILITFIPKFENCPRGYLGPGGKHDHGVYENCTGGKFRRDFFRLIQSFLGIAGYIDRKVLQPYHVFNHPTCKDIYNTNVPFDPEGKKA